jgi:hypothetical protein
LSAQGTVKKRNAIIIGIIILSTMFIWHVTLPCLIL